ncbi:MAG: PDDEXK nuclease domain-containing protein [Rickettsia endosymbiont of Argas persicus]
MVIKDKEILQAKDELSFKAQEIEKLFKKAVSHIDYARESVRRVVDSEMVKAYFNMGKDIVEEEQQGQKRSEYGSLLLTELSQRLTGKYGRGFSISTLKDIRQFYLVYSYIEPEQNITSVIKFEEQNKTGPKSHAMRGGLSFKLGWTHYRVLMRVKRQEARQFYEIEAIKNNWSGRELERQVNSLLFDRLLKSKDKQGLLELSCKGQEIQKFEDTIKEPLVLEFLGLPEAHQLVESKLEEALINNLQKFLLELGKGFAFIGRQKRLTLDGNHFYADLVFYHVILKCYVIIDIKTQKLTHGDLGQMLLYVNYFDQEIANEGDNPTIGLVLCTEKSDAMVKYTLGDKAKQIFASKYQFHLPSEEELEIELIREIKEIKRRSKTE